MNTFRPEIYSKCSFSLSVGCIVFPCGLLFSADKVGILTGCTSETNKHAYRIGLPVGPNLIKITVTPR